MNLRRVLALTGIVIIAILLAFPLRAAIYKAVIIPIAYVFWALGLWYRSVNQSFWWFVVLFVVLVTLARSLQPTGSRVGERIRNQTQADYWAGGRSLCLDETDRTWDIFQMADRKPLGEDRT